jgi:hypothetical protein
VIGSIHYTSAALFLLLSLLAAPVVRAQATLSGKNWDWDFGVWATVSTGDERTNSLSEAQIFAAGVSAGIVLTNAIGGGWRRGRLEYAVSFMPLFYQIRPLSMYGKGFEPLILRWNLGVRRRRLAPYIELGGGGLWTTGNFPRGNTSNFNFTVRGGGGVQVMKGRHQSIEIGCRWAHISNANFGVQNPEFNGIQVNIGYHRFR